MQRQMSILPKIMLGLSHAKYHKVHKHIGLEMEEQYKQFWRFLYI